MIKEIAERHNKEKELSLLMKIYVDTEGPIVGNSFVNPNDEIFQNPIKPKKA